MRKLAVLVMYYSVFRTYTLYISEKQYKMSVFDGWVNEFCYCAIRENTKGGTVFNQKTKDATAALYENLTEKINRV